MRFGNQRRCYKGNAINFGNQLKTITNHLEINENKITVVEHHLSHAASAHIWHLYELVITCDGSDDGIFTAVNIDQNGKISRIAKTEKHL